MRFFWHTLTNTALLGLLLLILTLPVSVSYLVTLRKDAGPAETAFSVRPSSVDYGGFLSYGQVAGGQAESLSFRYTAFSGFTAYYEVYVVENTQAEARRFAIKVTEGGSGGRLFFGGIGEESGPTAIVLEPGEKAGINLAAASTRGQGTQTRSISFLIQSLPLATARPSVSPGHK
jgi:hypothetical protein